MKLEVSRVQKIKERSETIIQKEFRLGDKCEIMTDKRKGECKTVMSDRNVVLANSNIRDTCLNRGVSSYQN